ncbi:MAG: hypothetical protein ABI808_07675 [Pseudonocardiales bacterium]
MTAIDTATPPRGRTCARPRVLTAAALALTLALTGCGGSAKPAKQKAAGTGASSVVAGSTAPASPTTAAAGTGSQPSTTDGGGFCSLVTAEEAHAIVGIELTPGRSRTGPGPAGPAGSCLYKAATPDPKAPTVVQVIVLGTKVPRSVYESELKHDPEGGPTTAVPGLGEDAFSIPGIVTVFDHGLVLTLEVVKGGRPGDTAAVVALVRTALSRAGALG